MIDVFKIESNDNTLFVTSQCNNRCLMCCQPPIKTDDIDLCFSRNVEIIENSPIGIKDIGISGGEPTLLGDKLPELIKIIRRKYADAHIHVLSNGRLFKEHTLVKSIIDAAVSNITVGVPLHSDYENDHDIIAGIRGAYQETLYGLYNLYNYTVVNSNLLIVYKDNKIKYTYCDVVNLIDIKDVELANTHNLRYTLVDDNYLCIKSHDEYYNSSVQS